jgi:hypothetical protein
MLEKTPKIKNTETWKGTAFWTEEIKKVGVYDQLLYFNDVVTEDSSPHAESNYHLVLTDVILDGRKCDIYHTDQDENGNRIKNHSFHRIFIHKK